MKKLLLIKPAGVLKHYSTQIEVAKLLGKRTGSVPLALPVIASITPKNYKIKIIDEDVSSLPKWFKPDLVGITMITSNSERGYEIAKKYRKLGAKVVLGGAYPSFNIEEGLKYADSIIVGEAENSWKKLIKDFEKKSLKSVYRAEEHIEFSEAIMPRWDLIDTKKMFSIPVQASRGCPFMCEFCLTTQIYGRKVRRRKIEDVINEIKKLPKKNILFVDENLTIDKKYAKELFRQLIPLKVSWICQSSVDVADDKEMLNLMAEAGCRHLVIGFESLKPDSLKETHKFQNNPENYVRVIENINKAGIHVYASFIIGFDEDKPEDFDVFRKFIENSQLPVFNLSILGASKGMELHKRLEKENRVLCNLSKKFFVGGYPVLKYKNFNNKDFFDKYNEIIEHLYSFSQIRKRTIRLLKKGYFCKDRNSKVVSLYEKIRTTIILFFSYNISKNKDKRLFFKEVIALIKSKKVSVGEAASILLIFEAITRHIKKDKKQRKLYYEELKRIELD